MADSPLPLFSLRMGARRIRMEVVVFVRQGGIITDKYIEYVNANTENIANYVTSCFEASKDLIRAKLIKEIKEYITPPPTHYVWEYDGNPYDCSGEIIEDGVVNLNQTVKEFLENEYSGNQEPTFTSGMGWHYNNYEDELHYYTIELAGDIMNSAIRRCIETKFSVSLSDDDLEQIKESCDEFDEIYENCTAFDFFCSCFAVEFVGIENMKLTDI